MYLFIYLPIHLHFDLFIDRSMFACMYLLTLSSLSLSTSLTFISFRPLSSFLYLTSLSLPLYLLPPSLSLSLLLYHSFSLSLSLSLSLPLSLSLSLSLFLFFSFSFFLLRFYYFHSSYSGNCSRSKVVFQHYHFSSRDVKI